jgi:hypothetical protein
MPTGTDPEVSFYIPIVTCPGVLPPKPEGSVNAGTVVPNPNEIKYGSIFGSGLDPLTAGLNAAAAFFNFLSTVQGQRVTKDILDFDANFVHKCHDIFVKIHDGLAK